MVGQCLGRKLEGLPLTLLEYHVLLHVCYTIVVYLFWMHKPLDVTVPLTLPISTRPADSASSSLPDHKSHPAEKSEVVNSAIIEHFRGPGDVDHYKHCDIGPGYSLLFDFLTEDRNPDSGFAGLVLRSWCDCTIILCRSTLGQPAGITIGKLLRLLFIVAIGMMNGALHTWAWNYDFPTETEKVLYRISCILSIFITVATCGLFFENGLEWHVVNLFYQQRFKSPGGKSRVKSFWYAVMAGVGDEEHHKGLARFFSRPFKWLWFSLFAVLFFVYYAAMGFITLETVLSVRALPKGSYKTVEWAEMFPHV